MAQEVINNQARGNPFGRIDLLALGIYERAKPICDANMPGAHAIFEPLVRQVIARLLPARNIFDPEGQA